jgi:hypothetical protein
MDHYFLDEPNRGHYSDLYWVAELSILGKNENIDYQRIATMTWGFYISGKDVYIYIPIMVKSPSPFHLNSIP